MKRYMMRLGQQGPLLLIGACLVLGLGLAFAFGTHGDSAKAPRLAPDAAVVSPSPDIMGQQIAAANLATKTAMQASDTQAQQTAAAAFTGKGPDLYTVADIPDPPLPTGIFTGDTNLPSLPGWGSIYHVTNTWQNVRNDTRYAAYAGLEYDGPLSFQVDTPSQPAQGVIVILELPSDPMATVEAGTAGGTYLTPTRAGAVQIMAAMGFCLTLLSTNGAQFQFDVDSLTWSCAAGTNPAP
jgi:hypothetical protein